MVTHQRICPCHRILLSLHPPGCPPVSPQAWLLHQALQQVRAVSLAGHSWREHSPLHAPEMHLHSGKCDTYTDHTDRHTDIDRQTKTQTHIAIMTAQPCFRLSAPAPVLLMKKQSASQAECHIAHTSISDNSMDSINHGHISCNKSSQIQYQQSSWCMHKAYKMAPYCQPHLHTMGDCRHWVMRGVFMRHVLCT